MHAKNLKKQKKISWLSDLWRDWLDDSLSCTVDSVSTFLYTVHGLAACSCKWIEQDARPHILLELYGFAEMFFYAVTFLMWLLWMLLRMIYIHWARRTAQRSHNSCEWLCNNFSLKWSVQRNIPAKYAVGQKCQRECWLIQSPNKAMLNQSKTFQMQMYFSLSSLSSWSPESRPHPCSQTVCAVIELGWDSHDPGSVPYWGR